VVYDRTYPSGNAVMEVWYAIVILELIILLYLAWKVHSLAEDVSMAELVLVSLLDELYQKEED
jgi:hypothetical protein